MTDSAGQTPDVRSTGSQLFDLPRAFVILLSAAAAVVVLAGLQAAAWLVAPTFLALILVITMAPVASWLRRRGWPGSLTTLVLVICVFGGLLVLALGIVVSVAALATELPRYTGAAHDMAAKVTSWLAGFGVGTDQLRQAADSLDLGKLGGLLASLLGSIAGLASSFVFLLALLLFLSVESSGVGDRLASIGADRPRVTAALGRFARNTRQYLLVTTVFGLIVAVLDSVALAIMNVPLAVIWGLLAFITNYIPNVGFVIGLLPPALLALLSGGPDLMVAVIVVYGLLNFVLQSLVQPRFIGDAVGLSVTVTFLAFAFWAWLLGPLGAILAIPLTLLLKALLVDIDPRARWADALLRSSPKEGDVAELEVLAQQRKTQRRRWRLRKQVESAESAEPVAT
ncbi:AI-2E family transporter [Lentzea tibetensis]|uniref:AI-2E family transporter n=1 Tax=Lentzea tibetensis TaxID=2591470 RepID=A0A563EQE5_9PSEU|nr:AI-2E family transporter [Lentzea tibetensis]TWP49448.1 AI-2E family transporter [Lentzea tibetensis]